MRQNFKKPDAGIETFRYSKHLAMPTDVRILRSPMLGLKLAKLDACHERHRCQNFKKPDAGIPMKIWGKGLGRPRAHESSPGQNALGRHTSFRNQID